MIRARRLLLVDACVIIDFKNASHDTLLLANQRVGRLHVTPTALQDVVQIRPEDANRWGLTVVEPSLDALAWAAEKRGRLSFEDRLAIAVSIERAFTCVSNDPQLRAECGRRGVEVIWGLDLLADLVQARAISLAEAENIGNAICCANIWLGPSVLESFLERIRQ